MDLTTCHKPLEPPEHSIVYNAAITILISVIGYSLHFTLNLLFARHLKPDVYGDLSIVIRVISLCALLGVFGINSSVIRFFPLYIKTKQKEFARGLLHWNTKIVRNVSIILTTIGALLAITAFILDKLGIHTLDKVHPVIFAFWLIPLYVFTILYGKTLQGAKQFGVSLLTMNLGLSTVEIILFLVFIFFFKSISIYNILLILGIAHTLAVLLQVIFLHSTILHQFDNANPQYKTRKWFRFSLKMLVNNLLLYTGSTIPLLALEILGKNENEVGMFAAILTINGILFLISGAIKVVINPSVSENKNDKTNLQRIINKAIMFQVLILSIVFVAGLFFANHLLAFFRPSYTVVLPSFIVSFCGAYLGLFFSMAGSVLLYAGFEKQELFSNSLYLVSTIIFSIILIPRFQIMGAAIAISLGSLSAYIYDLILCRMKVGIKALFIF